MYYSASDTVLAARIKLAWLTVTISHVLPTKRVAYEISRGTLCTCSTVATVATIALALTARWYLMRIAEHTQIILSTTMHGTW